METKNQDILSMTKTFDQIMTEINNSASTNITGVTDSDLARWKSYVQALREYAAWVMQEPSPLDMPKTHAMTMTVPEPPVLEGTQNRAADDLVRMLGLERFELVDSQSSGLSSGLISYDYARLLSVLTKCDHRITLAEENSPIDAPWTLADLSDSEPLTSRGVNLP